MRYVRREMSRASATTPGSLRTSVIPAAYRADLAEMDMPIPDNTAKMMTGEGQIGQPAREVEVRVRKPKILSN